ncbi:IS1 family transposase [Sodalis endosymbiont of Spalangia cameroni]
MIKINYLKALPIKRLARKTICFSRSVEIHEKVIGAFIEKHMFY